MDQYRIDGDCRNNGLGDAGDGTDVTAGEWVSTDPQAPFGATESLLPSIFRHRPEWFTVLTNVDTEASEPVVWDFLASLALAENVKVIVEAGTYRGHASMAMAEACSVWNRPETHIYTADVTDHHATDIFTRMGLASFITFFHGRFEDMPVPGPVDLAFVDASELATPYLRLQYVNLLLPRMAPNGLIVVDDATDDGWPGAKLLREQCDVYLQIGRGLALFQSHR